MPEDHCGMLTADQASNQARRFQHQMRPQLNSLPYEVLSYIISYINFEDVISLARSTKQLQFLEREDNICRKVLEEKLAFCNEAIAARKAGGGFAQAMRRVAKRQEAVATARPFSVAIIGFGDNFLYSCGILCYILDENLRILDLRRSGNAEILVSIPRLLQNALFDSEKGNRGRFRVLYCNESIICCLYTSHSPDSMASLIAFELKKGDILLVRELPSFEKIFVRHNSEFLYYGTYSEEDSNGHKKWVLQGYCFEKKEWFSQRVFLRDLNGSELGSSICFEIYDGYFYALSNQTNYEVEEVDWTSFYHCVRFPVGSPSKQSMEKTALDERMWRRQHKEGPIDDRWANLALKRDEATGELKIIECRREFLSGAGRSQRTFYTTKLIFPSKRFDEVVDSQALFTSTAVLGLGGASSSAAYEEISLSNGSFERHTLAALTNDRLALTLKPSDNPHWLPAQIRFPQNFHRGDDGDYIFSQTHLRYYNFSAMTFLDLINDPRSTHPSEQRLILRVGSRKLDRPRKDCNEILVPEANDPATGEVLYGLNDTYTALPVAVWPRESKNSLHSDSKRVEDLYALMNPPGHWGNIEVAGDDRSFVYATGGKNQMRAIIFVSFDPTINLGLERWYDRETFPKETQREDYVTKDRLSEVDLNIAENRELPEKSRGRQVKSPQIPTLEDGDSPASDSTKNWIWQQRPMYKYILKGFNFGL